MWKTILMVTLGLMLMALTACSPVPAVGETPQATPTRERPTPAPPPTVAPEETPLPSYVKGPSDYLAKHFDISPDEIQVKEVEEVDWPDSCLGAPQPDEACLEVITPGERVILDTTQGEFEFHTSANGAVFRLAGGPSGVHGQAVVGPTCPVVKEGSECPDQAIQVTITVLDNQGEQVTQVKTDLEGLFTIFLKPGRYTLQPEKFTPFPIASDQEVKVSAGEMTQVEIQYDSGIR